MFVQKSSTFWDLSWALLNLPLPRNKHRFRDVLVPVVCSTVNQLRGHRDSIAEVKMGEAAHHEDTVLSPPLNQTHNDICERQGNTCCQVGTQGRRMTLILVVQWQVGSPERLWS